MMTAANSLLLCVAILLAVPVLVFFVEIVAGCVLQQRDRFAHLDGETAHRVAVLIPAHNESAGLLPTLADVKTQLRNTDRIVVVADNCTDDTSTVAAGAGSEVVERKEPGKMGKGFAIARGLQYLAADPPDILIVIDADCRLAHDTLDKLAAACAFSGRPVQGNYIMAAPANAPIGMRVAEFAHLVKDTVRPLGLKALGLPCQLMGTGMAFPWKVIRSVDVASGLLIEDLKLGLDLALAGYPPEFCPSATLMSEFPSSSQGIQSQRLRWERGHLGMILLFAPRLILISIMRGNTALLAQSLDAAVPPVILLAILVVGLTLLAALTMLLNGSPTALIIGSVSTFCLFLGIFLAWFKYGRQNLPARAALAILAYVFSKLHVYGRILSSKSGSQWTRTDRNKS